MEKKIIALIIGLVLVGALIIVLNVTHKNMANKETSVSLNTGEYSLPQKIVTAQPARIGDIVNTVHSSCSNVW